MQIALLEDDVAIQEMLLLVLHDVGYNVSIYATAEAFLQAIEDVAAIADVPFDLFIIDWRLPGNISGIEVIRHIQSDSRFASTPIILTTAASIQRNKELQNLPATILEKPFDINEMVTTIQALIKPNIPTQL